MKNKKGYTLIEIIIALVLIVLIGSISIISIKKTEDTPSEEKEKYVESIKLDAAVYYENNKNLAKFEDLNTPGEYAIIQLKELIAEGVLDEKKFNPIRNTSSGESDYDCVKVFLDSNSVIDIDYPSDTCEGKTEEEIEEELKKGFLHVTGGDVEYIFPKTDSEEFFNNYSSSHLVGIDYFYQYFVDPGLEIRNIKGEILAKLEHGPDYYITNNEDNLEENIITFNYTIDNDDILTQYNLSNTTISRNIKLIDNSGPVLIGNFGIEANKKTFDVDIPYTFCYWGEGINYVVGTVDRVSLDNFDGINSLHSTDYWNNFINVCSLYSYSLGYKGLNKIQLKDSNDNLGYEYDFNYEITESVPIVKYDGPLHFYEGEVYYSDGVLYPLQNYVSASDDDWEEVLEYYYFLSDYNGKSFDNNYGIIPTGVYNFTVAALDIAGEAGTTQNDIYIDYYDYYDDYYYDDYYYDYDYYPDNNYCDDYCIIEQMKNNSEDWHNPNYSDEMKEYLHYQNEELASQLSAGTYYDESTGDWYVADSGGYLYDYYDNGYYGW